jgi:hypothetical protein
MNHKRYAASEAVAWEELAALGCFEQLTIEAYEWEGIEWECRVEPLSGGKAKMSSPPPGSWWIAFRMTPLGTT